MSSNTYIRTGTGDISVAAANNIKLNSGIIVTGTGSNQAAKFLGSSIYTAGRPVATQYASGGSWSVLADGRRVYTYGASLDFQGRNSFTMADGGGDITLAAGLDIVGGGRDQIGGNSSQNTSAPLDVKDWLLAQGSLSDNVTTAWGAAYGSFREGVAAMGGGNVAISVGRDISALNAATATNGAYVNNALANLVTHGGGDLDVVAGRDILGGQFYVGRGERHDRRRGQLHVDRRPPDQSDS